MILNRAGLALDWGVSERGDGASTFLASVLIHLCEAYDVSNPTRNPSTLSPPRPSLRHLHRERPQLNSSGAPLPTRPPRHAGILLPRHLLVVGDGWKDCCASGRSARTRAPRRCRVCWSCRRPPRRPRIRARLLLPPPPLPATHQRILCARKSPREPWPRVRYAILRHVGNTSALGPATVLGPGDLVLLELCEEELRRWNWLCMRPPSR